MTHCVIYERVLIKAIVRRNGHQLARILYKRDTWLVITIDLHSSDWIKAI